MLDESLDAIALVRLDSPVALLHRRVGVLAIPDSMASYDDQMAEIRHIAWKRRHVLAWHFECSMFLGLLWRRDGNYPCS